MIAPSIPHNEDLEGQILHARAVRVALPAVATAPVRRDRHQPVPEGIVNGAGHPVTLRRFRIPLVHHWPLDVHSSTPVPEPSGLCSVMASTPTMPHRLRKPGLLTVVVESS